jgi:hypothetical protein
MRFVDRAARRDRAEVGRQDDVTIDTDTHAGLATRAVASRAPYAVSSARTTEVTGAAVAGRDLNVADAERTEGIRANRCCALRVGRRYRETWAVDSWLPGIGP